jgi:hypothetical protein
LEICRISVDWGFIQVSADDIVDGVLLVELHRNVSCVEFDRVVFVAVFVVFIFMFS